MINLNNNIDNNLEDKALLIIYEFLKENPSNKDLDSYDTEELRFPHIEKSTVKDLIHYYIDDLNENLKNGGTLWDYYDTDMVIIIKYKNGNTSYISPQFWDEDKKIKTTAIDSIIISSGWGDAIAGNSIDLEIYDIDYDGWVDVRPNFN